MSDEVYLIHECHVSGQPIMLSDGVSCPWCRATAIVKVVGQMVYLESLMERIVRLERGRQVML